VVEQNMITTILLLPFTLIGFFIVYSGFNPKPLENLNKHLNRFNKQLAFKKLNGYSAKNKLESIKFMYNTWKQTR